MQWRARSGRNTRHARQKSRGGASGFGSAGEGDIGEMGVVGMPLSSDEVLDADGEDGGTIAVVVTEADRSLAIADGSSGVGSSSCGGQEFKI